MMRQRFIFSCLFFSSRRRHTRFDCDWSSDVCSSDLGMAGRHQARNALAALAAGRFAGVPLADGAAALAGGRVAPRLGGPAPPGGETLVDDPSNASPEAMLAPFQGDPDTPRPRPRPPP